VRAPGEVERPRQQEHYSALAVSVQVPLQRENCRLGRRTQRSDELFDFRLSDPTGDSRAAVLLQLPVLGLEPLV
jgi:hypothetical protein